MQINIAFSEDASFLSSSLLSIASLLLTYYLFLYLSSTTALRTQTDIVRDMLEKEYVIPGLPIKMKCSVHHWTLLKLNIDLHGTNKAKFDFSVYSLVMDFTRLTDGRELCWMWLMEKIQNLINGFHWNDKDVCLYEYITLLHDGLLLCHLG